MRILILCLFLFSTGAAYAQSYSRENIDSNNYYDYYSQGRNLKGSTLKTSWLGIDDAIPIIKEEMERAGIEWLSTNSIFKLESGQIVSLSAYSRKSNFGFLFIQVHGAFPEKGDRKNLLQSYIPNVAYIQDVETYKGKAEFIRIPKLPPNIFILNSNCYWYQQTEYEEDNNKLITKEIAERILKNDIDRYLKQSGLKSKFTFKSN